MHTYTRETSQLVYTPPKETPGEARLRNEHGYL